MFLLRPPVSRAVGASPAGGRSESLQHLNCFSHFSFLFFSNILFIYFSSI